MLTTRNKVVISPQHLLDAKNALATNKLSAQIAWIGCIFQKELLDSAQQNSFETELAYVHLSNQQFAEIKANAKPENAASLSCIYWLLEQQPRGEEGILLTNGSANFFIFSQSGRLFIVYVHWIGNGWAIGASSIDCFLSWGQECRLFYRL